MDDIFGLRFLDVLIRLAISILCIVILNTDSSRSRSLGYATPVNFMSDHSSWHPHERYSHAGYGTSYSGPYIENSISTNISAQEGGHAYLPCTVKRLGSRSVSWIRKQDGYLLTVDRDAFIVDNRFQALHVVASDTWTLHIRNVKAEDAGNYECQVSSEPKTSLLFTLHVVTPRVEIRGSPDMYVKSGSRVELQCILTDVLEEPPFIFWYHQDQRIVTDSGRVTSLQEKKTGQNPDPSLHHQQQQQDPGQPQAFISHDEDDPSASDHFDFNLPTITMSSNGDDVKDPSYDGDYVHYDVTYESKSNSLDPKDRNRKASVKSTAILRIQPGTLISLLVISSASLEDSGFYQCRPSNIAWANVTLHVLDGEHEEPAAAIQDGTNSSSAVYWRFCISTMLSVTVATSILVW